MKKQLLIAAVAATMTSVAMADISISGAAKVNYTHVDNDGSVNDSDTFKQEMDLKIAGKSGDTSVTMNFGGMDSSSETNNDAVSTFNLEDAYVATSIEGVNVKVGQWDNGNNELRASSRKSGKFAASTTVSGVTVTYEAGNATDDTVKVAGDVAGVALSFKDVKTGEDISVSTTVGGVSLSYLALNRDEANTDRSVATVSSSFGGVDVKYAQANAESGACISGDTWMGDFEHTTYTCSTTDNANAYYLNKDQDVAAISLKTSMAGNTVEFRNIEIDGTAGDDTSINKFIVTRALANGATFEATYADVNDDGAATDNSSLDLELAVKF